MKYKPTTREIGRTTTTKSTTTKTRTAIPRTSTRTSSSKRVTSKRRISSSRKNIKRPIPRKIKSPKVNRNVTRQAMKPKQMDYAIFFTVLMLVIFGIIMVFSSSYYHAMIHDVFNNKYHFVIKQAQFAVLGFGAMMFMTFFDYRKIKKYSMLGYIGINVLLVLVLILGIASNGAQRWILGIQPSEPAKLILIIFLAYIIDKNPKLPTTLKGFFICIALVGIPAVLIAKENLSTAIVVLCVGIVMIFVAGAKTRYFVGMSIPGLLFVAAMLLPEKYDYRKDRIRAWIDPFAYPDKEGYQTIQSLYAIASGGLFGSGLGNSVQKLGYIPEAYNDIIFSIVCDELGLVGAGALILLFVILISRGIRIALKAKDLFASLIATGISSMIAIQAIINISVVTNAIPNTGMALPFISYGGSSLCMLMISMGILLNISCYTKS